ncbi:MAG: methionine synthase [Bryobacteraceae bacterium]|nr:methionine synthase [Bryobacteraceae bacterium]
MRPPFAPQSRLFFEALEARILVLDGAMGTMLQRAGLSAEDFGGTAFEGCNENLVLTRPDVVLGIHRAYLQAGADIIETNTFGATEVVLAEYGLADRVEAINVEAAQLARRAAAEYSGPSRPRFVAGSIGPTTRSLSVTGGITFEQLREAYFRQAAALVTGGVDLLLVETCQDTLNAKAALVALDQLFDQLGYRLPVIVSCTIEPGGAMLAGQTADAFWISIAHADPAAVGLNCATGPDLMRDHLRTLHELAWTRTCCYPNAGLPLEDGTYPESPGSLARQLAAFARNGWLNIVGGCCGTTPDHIHELAAAVEGLPPRRPPDRPRRTFFAGIEVVEAEETNRPLLVGERTNVVGSRQFRQLVAEERWDEAAEIARKQVRGGAHIVDVCLQSSDRDELRDIAAFYPRLVRKVRAPIMIDSTDPRAIELALKHCQGKPIINSINLEDGEEKFARVAPLARAYGAAVVVGTIDEDPEQAQAFTRERKLAVARRAVSLLTGKYGLPPEDIILDPLVFPCATGDENYIGGAVETLEAVRLIKQEIPYVKTILGISNVSFGLPAAAREVVNSVFLYHATRAGLDLAIVNTERLERFASLEEKPRRLAEALLFNAPPEEVPPDHPQAALLGEAPADWRLQSREQRIAINQFHITALAAYFRGLGDRRRDREQLSLDERLARYIIEGRKDGLFEDLDRKLAEGATPLEIINGPLMAGMNEVGRLFAANELIVAEVLESAEAMKAAVSYLERFMDRSETASRGTMILATVKGDVHDIGKNLVDIILSNNGYRVINLGIKVPPEEIIRAWREHRPDAIGLSGLLVKSAHQMVVTVADLREAGIRTPVLVGGAALSARFTRERIAPAYGAPVIYARDAMAGLEWMNRLSDPLERERVLAEFTVSSGAVAVEPAQAPDPQPEAKRSSRVRTDLPIPPAPYTERRVLETADLNEIWTYLNLQMLFGKHLGFRGRFADRLAQRDPKALELYHQMEEVKRWAAGFLRVRAVWQFFEAEREGNAIHLFAPGGAQPLHSFVFPRQPRQDGLCLSDYVLDPVGGQRDHIALFVLTAGEGVRERAEQAKQAGEFFRSHALQALALETAEAAAEWLHRRIREDWGFPDPPSLSMEERLAARYRGKRYSFGYAACPDLEDQRGIWKLLRPEEIGVHLTEGCMMDPEASVSALVFHHPDCIYFTVGEGPSGN